MTGRRKRRPDSFFPLCPFGHILLITLLFLSPAPIIAQPALRCSVDVASPALRLGVVLPLTGHMAFEGGELLKGYRFWLDSLIDDGNGIPVGDICYRPEIVVHDSQSDDASARAGLEHLLYREYVDLFLGGYPDSVLLMTAAIADQSDRMMIGGIARSATLFESGYEHLFAFYRPPEIMLSDSLVWFSRLEAQRIGVLTDAVDIEFIQRLPVLLQEAGIPSYEIIAYPAAPSDFTPTLTNLREYQPDVLILNGHSRDTLHILEALQRLDLNPAAILVLNGAEEPGYIALAAELSDYIWGAASWYPELPFSDDWVGSVNDYATAYLDRYGTEPGFLAASATNTMLVLQRAFMEAGTIVGQPVSDALHDLTMDTFWGTTSFDEAGKSMITMSNVIQVQERTMRVIGAGNNRVHELVWPRPPW